MSIITYSLLVGLILFLAFVMEQRTNRLRRDFEGLYNLRGRDIEARIALNDKFNSEMAELRDYIVGHFDEGSEFYGLRMEVADIGSFVERVDEAVTQGDTAIMSEVSALWSEAAAIRGTIDMQDRLRGNARVVEIKDPAPLWSPETGEANIVPQDEPMTPEENGAPENLTEQRITKLEQAVQTKASALQLIEQKDKLQALRIGILGGADESGLPIPGALSELRQQVEGINSHLGKKIENATKLNKAAIQLVAQSAARTEVRTILRKRKGFWAVTWGNFWRWLISPVK